jgi:hypothetical protein
VQWTRGGPAAWEITVGDVDQDGLAELVATETLSWKPLSIYNIDLGTTRTLANFPANGTLLVLNRPGQGPLLIAADSINLYVYDLVSGAHLWDFDTRNYGITEMIATDIDDDGVDELVWGSGSESNGPDNLMVFDPNTRTLEWKSIDLGGPLAGPEVGDLDGDGSPEVVAVSRESDSDYGSARFVILDSNLELRHVSEELSDGLGVLGTRDLRIRDLDGDGRPEILVGSDYRYGARIEVYRLGAGGAPELTETLPFVGNIVGGFDVVDVDGDGKNEIVALIGHGVDPRTGIKDGYYVHVYDYPSLLERWRSPKIGEYFVNDARGLVVANSDLDPAPEIHAVLRNPQTITIFDGRTGALERTVAGTAVGAAARPPGIYSLYVGDALGNVTVFRNHGRTAYETAFTQHVSDGPIDGITDLGHSVWIGARGRLSRFQQNGPHLDLSWTSRNYGPYCGRRVVASNTGSKEVLTASWYSILQFPSGGL